LARLESDAPRSADPGAENHSGQSELFAYR